MTNTLHRYGDAESFRDDLIVFAMATRGVNDAGCAERLRSFLRLALKHRPVNLGDARKGGVHQPSRRLNPLAHWRRAEPSRLEEVIDAIDGPTTVSAVFDNPENLAAFLAELKEADLGLSVNVSGLMDDANLCCQKAGMTRHSVEYSLGFRGQMDRLPERAALELSTMCGHGMVSANFARKMLDWVKEGRRTPAEACRYLARFCVCGIFNTTRAQRILDRARRDGP